MFENVTYSYLTELFFFLEILLKHMFVKQHFSFRLVIKKLFAPVSVFSLDMYSFWKALFLFASFFQLYIISVFEALETLSKLIWGFLRKCIENILSSVTTKTNSNRFAFLSPSC